MIAFTLCSNNYLPYAGVLCASLKQFHPDWFFVLGLVDKRRSEIDYSAFPFDEVLPVEDVSIPGFQEMAQRYNVIELNTAVKPFYFARLFQTFAKEQQILYFDPDIQILDDLHGLCGFFKNADVLLIPHFSTPHSNQPGIITPEQRILQRGLYNLGFLGLQRSDTASQLLAWWQKRLEQDCRLGPEKGLFVDQKWMDLAPVYFDRVAVIKQRGYDVAYWNLYENDLHQAGGQVYSGDSSLKFYHFSAFRLNDPGYIEGLANHFEGEKAETIRCLYQNYRSALLSMRYSDYRGIPYAYQSKDRLIPRAKKWIKQVFRNLAS